ncbi:proprotein convertase P-domain-containing protein [Aurantibacter crassamenti]|uniref:reprolysin-like metallopeptidase n=1 Tax=Aurantibacter crassamenti TaxID=1837375 RepID=UPI00193A5F1B|nr:zinc-dependent metalloprotease family protein [Aurantibacter crassamenti]MBM1105579.1 proprotein convertase P-domain-containing protein [Aurantibacter crassamenti]
MVAKLRLVFSITILFLSFYGSSQSNYWMPAAEQDLKSAKRMDRLDINDGLHFSLRKGDFLNALKSISFAKNNSNTVYFPDVDGKLVAFNVKETPVMDAKLSAKYPSIKSYTGYGLQSTGDKVRFSVSHNGVQAMIVHGNGTSNTFMQKIANESYVVYTRDSFQKKDVDFICSTKTSANKIVNFKASAAKPIDGQVLRKFRLAVSATGEYTEFHGGTVASALAAINATVTRINEVFESDLAVTLELIATTDKVIYLDSDTDPYGSNLNAQAQSTFTDEIGTANYDIGHLFHKDTANGNAGVVGTVCVDNLKGSAFASHPNPEGDFFDLDYVAHEMGHQLGANHTWSFDDEDTAVQTEPGSGSTIMGYAGISGVDNVASSGDDYFHYNSIVQIADYLDGIGCAQETVLTNNPPSITPTGNFVIPKSTAFVLSGSASDIDTDDVLTYTWEQIDDGIITQANFGPNNPSGANFRSQRPSVDSVRYFPKLPRILSGNLTQTVPPINSAWESVSDIERDMNFALTVRDNAIGGGQVTADLVHVDVVNNAGPFLVTSQAENEVYVAGDVMEVTWDVANTDLAPVNALTVDIFLSIDAGATFPITMATNIANNGSHQFVVPGLSATNARVMVKANDNIFLAVNGADFEITESEVVLNFSEVEYDVCQPDSISTTFDYETYLGFNEEVTFSVFSAPPNLVVSFTPPMATVDTPVDVVFSNTENVPEGNYEVVLVATSATVSKKVTLDIDIFDSVFAEVVLNSPADAAVDASVSSVLQWQADSSITMYEVEIATDLLFANIIEDITQPENSYTPLNLVHEETYFWRVKPMNACGEGVFSNPFSFTTIEFNCANKAATSLPIEISPTGTPTITSKISFFEDLPLSDINVNLEIDHTFFSDLSVSLISPAGTKVFLVSNSCGDSDNINATFDDSGSAFVCGRNPAITGVVRPIGSLSTFNGESIYGEWTLEISDAAAQDGGVLKAFSLDICIEGEFRPDADKDGVFDDGDDVCLGTEEGAKVDSNGCAVSVFPKNNFDLTAQSESCRSSDDGQIKIAATAALNYTITTIGKGVNTTENFTNSHTISNLASGIYTVCLTASEGAMNYIEQCFEVVITEPDSLSVNANVNNEGDIVSLKLQGSDSYNIELNGTLITTEESEIKLSLKRGVNTLKVSTALVCQGIHEEIFFSASDVVVYPNPANDFTKIYLGGVGKNVKVRIFAADGRFVRGKDFTSESDQLEVDLMGLPSGIYYMRYEGENVNGTSKLIKL